jgi:P-type Ca2+ transporter type 2C
LVSALRQKVSRIEGETQVTSHFPCSHTPNRFTPFCSKRPSYTGIMPATDDAGKDGSINTVEEKKPQQKIVGFSRKSVFKKKKKKTEVDKTITASNGNETDATNNTTSDEKTYRISTFEISEKDLEIFGTNNSVEQKLGQLNKLGGLEKIMKILNTHELNGLCLPQDEKYATKKKSKLPDVAAKHRKSFGNNNLPNIPPSNLLHFIIEGFDDVTLLILLFASVLSFIIGLADDPTNGWSEGVSIILSIVFVSSISGIIEYSKDKSLNDIDKKSNSSNSTIMRNGKHMHIESKNLVVGDIIVLDVGNRVPCDCILLDEQVTIYSRNFTNNAGGRSTSPLLKNDKENNPFILSGYDIITGTCRALAISVGENSRHYKELVQRNLETTTKTPLQRRLQGVANYVTYTGIFFAIFIFIAQSVTFGNTGANEGQSDGRYFIDAIVLAATIVVVAIPEGLPMTVAISLGFRAKTILQQNLLIRNVSGNENMGYVTDILSNKTGTFTKNEMSCAAGWFADLYYSSSDGIPNGKKKFENYLYQALKENIAQNSSTTVTYHKKEVKAKSMAAKSAAFLGKMMSKGKDAGAKETKEADNGLEVKIYGTQTEAALIKMMIDKMGCAKDFFIYERKVNTRTCFYTFTPSLRISAAVVEKKTNGNGHRLYVKGAAEVVVKLCFKYLDHRAALQDLDYKKKQYFMNDLIVKMGKAQYRPIALAHCDFDDITKLKLPTNLQNVDWVFKQKLVLDAIVGIKDVLRDGISDAVLKCQKAGIKVRMITGEHIDTARAIGTRLNILTNEANAYLASDLERLSLSQIDKIFPSIEIIARCPPKFKKGFVSRLNGKALPRNKREWCKLHNVKETEWDQQASRLLPGYLDEWENHHVRDTCIVGVVGKHPEDILTLSVGNIGLALAKSSTTGAKLSSDISAMDDSFATIVNSVMWGRGLQENVRSFLQFQLTTNFVVLSFTLIVVLSGLQVPFNAVMLLWTNLIMDTLAAVAFGTEASFRKSMERLPYRRDANLINKEMKKNILVQGSFQLLLLFILFENGHTMFQKSDGTFVEKGNACLSYVGEILNGTSPSVPPTPSSAPRICSKYDYTHYTIIFNTFIFQQVFNFFNARRLEADVKTACTGFHTNRTFLGTIVFILIFQFLLVEVFSTLLKTSSLTVGHWIACFLMALFTVLPVGFLLRYFNNSKSDDMKIFSGYPNLVPPEPEDKNKTNGDATDNKMEPNSPASLMEKGKLSTGKIKSPQTKKKSKYVVK